MDIEKSEILRALFSEPDGSLDLYGLHTRFRLSGGQLSRVCREMAQIGVLTIDEADGLPTLTVRITEVGREWIFRHRRVLFLIERRREWAKMHERLRRDRLPAFAPYLPKSPLKKRFVDPLTD